MDSIFNEKTYRTYLEHIFLNDEANWEDRKNAIDMYSEGYLQKVVNDTSSFSMDIITTLKESEDTYPDVVFTQKECNIFMPINGSVAGSLIVDQLINPKGYPNDFFISITLLNMFFGYAVFLDENSLKISLSKEKFEPYLTVLNNDLIK